MAHNRRHGMQRWAIRRDVYFAALRLRKRGTNQIPGALPLAMILRPFGAIAASLPRRGEITQPGATPLVPGRLKRCQPRNGKKGQNEVRTGSRVRTIICDPACEVGHGGGRSVEAQLLRQRWHAAATAVIECGPVNPILPSSAFRAFPATGAHQAVLHGRGATPATARRPAIGERVAVTSSHRAAANRCG
jgi:hypothetical protein